MTSNGQFTSWSGFLQALQTRFAPSQYEDPTGALCKHTRCSTVSTYLSEFEDLANRIVGLPSPFLLSCFISGLTPEIRREVQAHQPLTLVQVAGLARLQEEKLLDTRSLSRARPHTLTAPPLRPLSSVATPLLPAPMKTPTPVPLKRLSLDKLASRRERGLCFNCDEQFHRGHKCASRMFLLITDEEDATRDDPTQLE